MSNDPSETKVDIEKINLLSQLKELCEHKWVFQRSDFQRGKRSQYKDYFKRIDTYYCEKCLEVKEVVTKEEDTFSEKPYWFEG